MPPARIVLGACLAAAMPLAAQTFSKEIAPIFAKHCIGCHAGTVKMGSLDLDTEEGIRRGGNHGAVLTPGKSAASRLYLMVAGKAAPAMPMSGEALPAADIETIRRWIDTGAPFDAGASPSALARPAAPALKPRGTVKPQITAMAWRPDGGLLALGVFREVLLLDGGGKPVAKLAGHGDQVRALAFSPEGKLLAAAGGWPARKGQLKLWDAATRAELRTIEGHTDCIYAAAFSRDGQQVATASYDKLIKLWDVATGNEIRTLKDHIDAVYALAFTPDGRYLLSASADRAVKVWDPASGERLYTLSEPLDGLNALAIHPGGKYVAAGGLDKTIRVWELGAKSGRLAASLIAHEDAILRLAYSPDGKTLVSSAADRSIKVLRADDLTELHVFTRQPDWVTAVEFAPDGRRLAVGRFDGSLEFLDLGWLGGAAVARLP